MTFFQKYRSPMALWIFLFSMLPLLISISYPHAEYFSEHLLWTVFGPIAMVGWIVGNILYHHDGQSNAQLYADWFMTFLMISGGGFIYACFYFRVLPEDAFLHYVAPTYIAAFTIALLLIFATSRFSSKNEM